MHTSLTQRSQSGLTMPMSRHSVGTYLEMSLYATCQGTFGHSDLSLLIHCGLILAQRKELLCTSKSPLKKKRKKKRRQGMNMWTSPPRPLQARKKPPPYYIDYSIRSSVRCHDQQHYQVKSTAWWPTHGASILVMSSAGSGSDPQLSHQSCSVVSQGSLGPAIRRK